MRVVHVCEDWSDGAGGVPSVVKEISRRSCESGITVDVLFVRENGMMAPAGVTLRQVKCGVGQTWGWSRGIANTLEGIFASHKDLIFHIHGVWMGPQWVAARFAKNNNIRFIFSAHGMLEPWQMKYKGRGHAFKRNMYLSLVAKPVLRYADVVHAITSLEKEHLKKYFPENRFEIIPNAVDISVVDDALSNQYNATHSTKTKTILFVGRLHPGKGVDILIRAFGLAGLPQEWELHIAGPDHSEAYTQTLQSMARETGLSSRIRFLGPIYGANKYLLYKSAEIVVVPSRSEVVALVNLEASACFTPTITTKETGLFDWEEGGGLIVESNVDAIAHTLRNVATWTRAERVRRGVASRRLIKDRYNWDVIAKQWTALYSELVISTSLNEVA